MINGELSEEKRQEAEEILSRETGIMQELAENLLLPDDNFKEPLIIYPHKSGNGNAYSMEIEGSLSQGMQ